MQKSSSFDYDTHFAGLNKILPKLLLFSGTIVATVSSTTTALNAPNWATIFVEDRQKLEALAGEATTEHAAAA